MTMTLPNRVTSDSLSQIIQHTRHAQRLYEPQPVSARIRAHRPDVDTTAPPIFNSDTTVYDMARAPAAAAGGRAKTPELVYTLPGP